jgi:isopenicillin N synthase-like dioxygenase
VTAVALPVIDVGPLVGHASAAARAEVAGQIQAACRERGFFYITGHDVPAGLVDQLAEASAEFFALPLADKLDIAMARGGRAWRGFFPVGAELTSGRPDLKEGLYFGTELPDDDPRVRARLPLHGAAAGDDGRRRWDGQDLRAFTGTYGDYLLGKVSKVFPQLRRDVLE